MPFSKAVEKSVPNHEGPFPLPFWEPFALIAMALLITIVYFNTVHGPFVLDDLPTIQDSPTIQISELTFGSLVKAATEHYYSSRPLACITIALNYYIGQEDPFLYHVFNILVHILTSIVLYYLIKNTLALVYQPSTFCSHKNLFVSRSSVQESKSILDIFLVSYFSALIWALHPVNTQAVNYIVQRMTSLSALFYILSIYLFIKARCCGINRFKILFFIGCGACAIFALASKENAATLPLTLFLFEWIFFNSAEWKWLKRKMPLLIGIVLIIGAVGFFFLDGHPFEKIEAKYAFRDFTLGQRVLTELRVVVRYIGLILYPNPSRLNIDYDFSISHSLMDPITTLLSLGIIAGLISASVAGIKKEPIISFCILWFFINLLIESSIIALELIFEHRMYLPSMFIIIIPVSLLVRYSKSLKLSIPVLILIVIICAVWAHQRNAFWKDDETLWRDAVVKSPKKARPNNNLGFAIAKKGRYDEAIQYYRSAIKIDPDFTDAYVNLGAALFQEKLFNEAISSLQKAIELQPDYVKAYINLGTINMQLGMVAEAISNYSSALEINPNFPVVYNSLGSLLASQGKTSDALKCYQKALSLNPKYSKAYNNIANLMIQTGQYELAIENYNQALLLDPDSAKAHNNLGVAFMLSGQHEKAVEQFQMAIALDPDYEKAKDNLGKALAE